MWDSSHIHTHHTINQIGASHKVLSYKQFSDLSSKMGLINIHQPSVHLEGEYQGADRSVAAERLLIKCRHNKLQCLKFRVAEAKERS